MSEDRLRLAAFLARCEGDSAAVQFLERHLHIGDRIENALAYWRYRRVVGDLIKLGMISHNAGVEVLGGRRWNYDHHRAMDMLSRKAAP